MNTITFVSFYATGEKNDDVIFFCFQSRFLPEKIKKNKNNSGVFHDVV